MGSYLAPSWRQTSSTTSRPVYSERCGLRVILYNAHTEAISPARFRAFVQVIPSAEMELERMRFLELSSDGTVLEAMLGPNCRDLSKLNFTRGFPRVMSPNYLTC